MILIVMRARWQSTIRLAIDCKQGFQDSLPIGIIDTVMHGLAIAAGGDEPATPEQGEMLRHGGYPQIECCGEVTH